MLKTLFFRLLSDAGWKVYLEDVFDTKLNWLSMRFVQILNEISYVVIMKTQL